MVALWAWSMMPMMPMLRAETPQNPCSLSSLRRLRLKNRSLGPRWPSTMWFLRNDVILPSPIISMTVNRFYKPFPNRRFSWQPCSRRRADILMLPVLVCGRLGPVWTPWCWWVHYLHWWNWHGITIKPREMSSDVHQLSVNGSPKVVER